MGFAEALWRVVLVPMFSINAASCVIEYERGVIPTVFNLTHSSNPEMQDGFLIASI